MGQAEVAAGEATADSLAGFVDRFVCVADYDGIWQVVAERTFYRYSQALLAGLD